MKNLLKPRALIVGLIVILSVVFFGLLFQWNLRRLRAEVSHVNITVSPKQASFPVGQKQVLSLVLQTENSSKKISGVDISIKAEGNARLVSIGNPAPISGSATGSAAFFTTIKKDVVPKDARVAAVAHKSTSELSSIVTLQLEFEGVATGSGKIVVDSPSLEVVGNIQGSAYVPGIIDEGIFTFTSTTVTTPTPTLTVGPNPTATPTPTPTPRIVQTISVPTSTPTGTSTCPLKSTGDANCSGLADLVDFEIWRREFMKEIISKLSDFNNDNDVTIIDFEIWRRSYFPQTTN